MNARDKEIWEKSQQWDSSDDRRGKLKILESVGKFAELVRADERNSWPAEMEAMERQVNILTDALAQARSNT